MECTAGTPPLLLYIHIHIVVIVLVIVILIILIILFIKSKGICGAASYVLSTKALLTSVAIAGDATELLPATLPAAAAISWVLKGIWKDRYNVRTVNLILSLLLLL